MNNTGPINNVNKAKYNPEYAIKNNKFQVCSYNNVGCALNQLINYESVK